MLIRLNGVAARRECREHADSRQQQNMQDAGARRRMLRDGCAHAAPAQGGLNPESRLNDERSHERGNHGPPRRRLMDKVVQLDRACRIHGLVPECR